MTDHEIYLSIVIASYKSASALEKNLSVLTNYLTKVNYSFEIIIVDDGSQDNGLTEDIALLNNCKYIHLKTNQGKGAAIKKGMLAAKGKFRIFTDADIPYEPDVIKNFLYYLDTQGYDMAVGDRTIGEKDYYQKVTVTRSFASKLFSFIVGRYIAGGVFDTQCGIKGFTKSSAEYLFKSAKINGFAFDVELFHIAHLRNLKIKPLAVNLRSQDGKSVNVLSNSIKMLLDLLKILRNKY